tara:strand:- start:2386 stop:3183 length:798 start_codon:yes stop_codon:yes gene_type:complete
MEYVFYLCLGAFSGLISGLFGLGGGSIIVPLLIFAFASQGIDAQIATHLAIGTSLATIAITSLSSIYTHHQKRAIRWDLVSQLTPGMIIGSVLGGVFAISLNGFLLQLMFGGFMVVVGLQMLIFRTVAQEGVMPSPGVLAAVGSGVGSISALFGIGGGTLTAPFLAHSGVRMHQAIGTAAACGLPIGIVATLVYSASDLAGEALPGASLGYVFLPAWIGIVVTSAPFARMGALLAHRINDKLLKRAFGWVVLLLGIRFIWINIHF